MWCRIVRRPLAVIVNVELLLEGDLMAVGAVSFHQSVGGHLVLARSDLGFWEVEMRND